MKRFEEQVGGGGGGGALLVVVGVTMMLRGLKEGGGGLLPLIVRPRSGARSGLSGENIALHSANTLFNTLPRSLGVTRHNIDVV